MGIGGKNRRYSSLFFGSCPRHCQAQSHFIKHQGPAVVYTARLVPVSLGKYFARLVISNFTFSPSFVMASCPRRSGPCLVFSDKATFVAFLINFLLLWFRTASFLILLKMDSNADWLIKGDPFLRLSSL